MYKNYEINIATAKVLDYSLFEIMKIKIAGLKMYT